MGFGGGLEAPDIREVKGKRGEKGKDEDMMVYPRTFS